MLPGRRRASHGRPKRRGPRRARPAAAPPWHVPGARSSDAGPAQDSERAIQDVGDASLQSLRQPADRPPHGRDRRGLAWLRPGGTARRLRRRHVLAAAAAALRLLGGHAQMSAPEKSPDNLPGPLAGVRVLELADEKGQFCGKLLADHDADVIKIEPPGGCGVRRVGPFLGDVPHPDRSLAFWYYNTSKRGITLDLERAAGARLFRRLAAGADVILETWAPGRLFELGLGYEALSKANP